MYDGRNGEGLCKGLDILLVGYIGDYVAYYIDNLFISVVLYFKLKGLVTTPAPLLQIVKSAT